jgi:hypothetical protein
MCWKCCFGWCKCNAAETESEASKTSRAIDEQLAKDKARSDRHELTPEAKIDWQQGTLTQQREFIHCSNVTPYDIRQSGGLDPAKGREKVTWGNGQSGQYLFAFPFEGGEVQPNPAAVRFGFAHGGFIYKFNLKKNTPFLSKSGVVSHSKEIAFLSKIPTDQLECYQWKNRKAVPIDIDTWKPV